MCNSSSITHLLFADDYLLLLKADGRNVDHLRHVLQLYEVCSGGGAYRSRDWLVGRTTSAGCVLGGGCVAYPTYTHKSRA